MHRTCPDSVYTGQQASASRWIATVIAKRRQRHGKFELSPLRGCSGSELPRTGLRRAGRVVRSTLRIDFAGALASQMSNLRRRTPSGGTNVLPSEPSEPVSSTSSAVSPGALAAYLRRKVPAAASLLIGVMVGLLVAQSLSGRREVSIRRCASSLIGLSRRTHGAADPKRHRGLTRTASAQLDTRSRTRPRSSSAVGSSRSSARSPASASGRSRIEAER